MRLNRRVPVGTHGDVRDRLFKENRLLVYRQKDPHRFVRWGSFCFTEKKQSLQLSSR